MAIVGMMIAVGDAKMRGKTVTDSSMGITGMVALNPRPTMTRSRTTSICWVSVEIPDMRYVPRATSPIANVPRYR